MMFIISGETIVLFFAAAVGLAFVPGPDNIFVLTQSALYGRIAGWLVTLGLCTGLLVHTAAVSFGVAAIFQTSASAFTALKLVGAAYLVYLAWKSFRARASDLSAEETAQPRKTALYYRGIVMNITNPKVAIFFLAFLPQFTDPSRGSLTLQLLLLGIVFIIATALSFGVIAFAAGFVGVWLKHSPRAQIIMNRVAAVLFLLLAIRLTLTT